MLAFKEEGVPILLFRNKEGGGTPVEDVEEFVSVAYGYRCLVHRPCRPSIRQLVML
jgi:hypothetical protein